MKRFVLLTCLVGASFGILANASESQIGKQFSLFDWHSAAEVRACFRGVAEADTEEELRQRYIRLLRDSGISPQFAKGNVVPVGYGAQLVVGRDSLTARGKGRETVNIPSNVPALFTVSEGGSWSRVDFPDETKVLVIPTNAGSLIVHIDDGVVSRLDDNQD